MSFCRRKLRLSTGLSTAVENGDVSESGMTILLGFLGILGILHSQEHETGAGCWGSVWSRQGDRRVRGRHPL